MSKAAKFAALRRVASKGVYAGVGSIAEGTRERKLTTCRAMKAPLPLHPGR